MAGIDELLERNGRYAAGHPPSVKGSPQVAIVVCMDARVLPSRVLGLEEGETHVIRNAGGRAADAIRSLVVSQTLLGTKEIMVIHHRDCGMLRFTNAELSKKVGDELGADDGGLDYLPFADVEQSVRDDVAELRASPLIDSKLPIRGFAYDEQTGRVEEIV